MYRVFEEKPENFSPKISVAACYIEVADQLLVLKRNKKSDQGETWGVPAGKIEEGEESLDATVREIFEETQIKIEKSDLMSLGQLWIEIPKFQYIYYLSYVKFEKKPFLELNKENTEYKWLNPEEIRKLNLIMGAEEALDLFLQRKGAVDVGKN